MATDIVKIMRKEGQIEEQVYPQTHVDAIIGYDGGAAVTGVSSVNGKTGDVTLNASDVGVAPTSHGHTNATASADGFMSKSDKDKLDSMTIVKLVKVGSVS